MSELGFLGLMGLGGNIEKARCLGALFLCLLLIVKVDQSSIPC
jgi:hypothetical protein